MGSIFREPIDYFFGTLAADLAVSDVQMSCNALANLTQSYTTSHVLPLTIHDPSQGVREEVWVTHHDSGSSQATIARGKEGTSALPWVAGTQVLCAPTATRDGLIVDTKANIAGYTDLHVGATAVELDTGAVKMMTGAAGLQAAVGMGLPGDQGSDYATGTQPPANATIICRAGHRTGVAIASGGWTTITLDTPFPNGILSVVITNTNMGQFSGFFQVSSPTKTGWQVGCFDVPPGGLRTSGSFSFNYVAIGW
jgi:hypothetical protein